SLAVSVASRDAQIGAVRLRQWERRVGVNGRERGDLRAVINVVVLVSSEEKNLVLDQRAAGASARIVVLKRDAEAARGVGVARVGIGVEAFVAEVIEGLTVKLIRAAAQTQVDATAGSSAVLGRELIGDHLDLFDGVSRKADPFTRAAVVVVVQAF